MEIFPPFFSLSPRFPESIISIFSRLRWGRQGWCPGAHLWPLLRVCLRRDGVCSFVSFESHKLLISGSLLFVYYLLNCHAHKATSCIHVYRITTGAGVYDVIRTRRSLISINKHPSCDYLQRLTPAAEVCRSLHFIFSITSKSGFWSAHQLTSSGKCALLFCGSPWRRLQLCTGAAWST